ncbi:hypothetical protein [Methanolobus sp. WCC4]|uniref:hypothetical protein n=1 Tax=Methanolobus sp. WCC4 TaxID=3125784 RepID=UPI0030F5AE6B
MTENKTEEQISAEEKTKRISGREMLQDSLRSPSIGENPIPAFGIEYAPHKSQGLQSASDMWIDKSRLFEGISENKRDPESIKKLSRQ